MNRCEGCGGRLDYPGLFGCHASGHPDPDIVQRIVLSIEADINDRRGIKMNNFDMDIQEEIREAWGAIIRKKLMEHFSGEN